MEACSHLRVLDLRKSPRSVRVLHWSLGRWLKVKEVMMVGEPEQLAKERLERRACDVSELG